MVLGVPDAASVAVEGPDGRPHLHLDRQDAAHPPRPGGYAVRNLAHPAAGRSRLMKKKHQLPVMDDPLWYKDAVIYQLHLKSFFDSNNDGVGDFPGLLQKLDYIAEPRRQRDLAAAVLSVPAARRRLRHRRLPRHSSRLRHACRFPPRRRRCTRARHSRHHRASHQSHLRPARVVPAGARGEAWLSGAPLLRLVGPRRRLCRHADHLRRHRKIELDLGHSGGGLLLAPLLRAPARSEFRQPAGLAAKCSA